MCNILQKLASNVFKTHSYLKKILSGYTLLVAYHDERRRILRQVRGRRSGAASAGNPDRSTLGPRRRCIFRSRSASWPACTPARRMPHITPHVSTVQPNAQRRTTRRKGVAAVVVARGQAVSVSEEVAAVAAAARARLRHDWQTCLDRPLTSES